MNSRNGQNSTGIELPAGGGREALWEKTFDIGRLRSPVRRGRARVRRTDLRVHIEKAVGICNPEANPRISTLNVLSRYIGKRDFNAFQQSIMSDGHYVSNFFSVKKVCTSDLKKGAEVLIGWAPNRLVTLRYDGDGNYTVIKSENSKLLEGDKFQAESFMVGYPLYIPRIMRNGEYTLSYIAGTQEGLNRADIISEGNDQ